MRTVLNLVPAGDTITFNQVIRSLDGRWAMLLAVLGNWASIEMHVRVLNITCLDSGSQQHRL